MGSLEEDRTTEKRDLQRAERALVRGCLEGTPGAWEKLADYGAPFMTRAIARTFRRYGAREQAASAEEILQEAFLALLRGDAAALRRFEWTCPLSHYLITIAVNCAVDWLRKNRPSRIAEPGQEEARSRLLEESGADSPPPETPHEERERDRAIRKAIARLPRRERAVLHLYYWGTLPTEAVARLMHLNPDSVRVFLSNARARLRDLLRSAPLLI